MSFSIEFADDSSFVKKNELKSILLDALRNHLHPSVLGVLLVLILRNQPTFVTYAVFCIAVAVIFLPITLSLLHQQNIPKHDSHEDNSSIAETSEDIKIDSDIIEQNSLVEALDEISRSTNQRNEAVLVRSLSGHLLNGKLVVTNKTPIVRKKGTSIEDVLEKYFPDGLPNIPEKIETKTTQPLKTSPTVEATLHQSFAGALTNDQFVENISNTLQPFNYNNTNTLVATSLCCDEVNRTLDNTLSKTFGHTFSMGGLAGFPFGGVTSFGAMAHHIPSGGSCIVVYGPHVGIDSNGKVGKINRRGRPGSGACCGSATAACGFVTSIGSKSPVAPVDPLDAQQGYVSSMLMPYASQLQRVNEEDRPTTLPYLLYDAQKKLVDRIVAAGCGEVGGDGKIALVGGIQINTPGNMPDYFLPLSFDVRSNKGAAIWSWNPKVDAVLRKNFPGALTNDQFVNKISNTLKPFNYNNTNTLVATSLCCDEVNRSLDSTLSKAFGHTFSMGGLAGFPFGGVTSFGAMAHHIPSGGSCIVVYGPHVGIDSNGKVGKINRRGRLGSGACCGSATAACSFVTSIGSKSPDAPVDPLDAQQGYVSSMLMPYAPRLLEVSEGDRPTTLPYLLYDAQKKLMDRIVAAGCGEVGGDGKIALVGGIQINTPGGMPDYFLPLSFDVQTNKGESIKA